MKDPLSTVPSPKVQVKPLSEGLDRILGAQVVSHTTTSDQVLVTGVTNDSRKVEKGYCFFALTGENSHGAAHAADALTRGATAIVTDELGFETLSLSQTNDALVVRSPLARESFGPFASWVYGDPSNSLQVIGVTGTNGKTTTSWFVEAAAAKGGLRSASLGTTGLHFEGNRYSLARTTPEAGDLQAALAFLCQSGAEVVAAEVSSHALTLGRVNGTRFAEVGFTGLSQDHLDFHGDMHAYFQAKASLFTKRYSEHACVVLDEWGKKLISDIELSVETVGARLSGADWELLRFESNGGTSSYEFRTPSGAVIEGSLCLVGEFNAMNALLAVALAARLGVKPEIAAAAIADVQIPGRMQIVRSEAGIIGLVDYAHTPDAIARVIKAVREHVKGRVMVVFGAGGNRDRDKRPGMGAAASEADLVWVTDDNPRDEDAAKIRAELAAGVANASTQVVVFDVADRREAIELAAESAKAGDVVLVLGKGHETGQEIAGAINPFDDFAELTRALGPETRLTGRLT